MKIKKGDEVIVLLGKDKGKKGKVEQVLPKKNAVVVKDINVFKRHKKKQSEESKGQIVDIVKPLGVSKVALVCPHCKKPTRVGYSIVKSEKKRICKKCKEELDTK